jgi:hypothetical protein
MLVTSITVKLWKTARNRTDIGWCTQTVKIGFTVSQVVYF